jgi:hypothetical protein
VAIELIECHPCESSNWESCQVFKWHVIVSADPVVNYYLSRSCSQSFAVTAPMELLSCGYTVHAYQVCVHAHDVCVYMVYVPAWPLRTYNFVDGISVCVVCACMRGCLCCVHVLDT